MTIYIPPQKTSAQTIKPIKNGGAIILTEYDKLLEDARAKAEAFKSTAKEIPKMYSALRNENSNLTSEDARDR